MILLSVYGGEEDVLFGAPVSGRPGELPGIETMVGLFINTLPVRVRISPREDLLSLFREIHARQAEREQYAHTPLPRILEASELDKGTPLFRSILAFENYPTPGEGGDGDGDLLIEAAGGYGKTNYPITAAVIPGDELIVRIDYDRDRFDPGLVRRVLRHFRILLETAADHPRKRISEIRLLTPAERRRILEDCIDAPVDYTRDRTIIDLFERQARKTPNNTAVVFEDRRLTYDELNRRANRLARRLLDLIKNDADDSPRTAEPP